MPPTNPKDSKPASENAAESKYYRSSFAVVRALEDRIDPFTQDLGIRSLGALVQMFLENPKEASEVLKPFIATAQKNKTMKKTRAMAEREERKQLMANLRTMPLEDLKQLQKGSIVKASH